MHGTSRFDVKSFLHCRNQKKFFKVQSKQTKQLYIMEVVEKNTTTMNVENTSAAVESYVKSIPSGNVAFCMELKFFFETDSKWYYVLDYVGETNLAVLMKEYDRLAENVVSFIAAELAMALKGLHERGLGYGELNMDTVMVDSNGHIVLWREFFKKRYWDVCECLCCLLELSCGNPRHAGQRGCENKACGGRSSVEDHDTMRHDWQSLGVLLYALLVGSLSEETSLEEASFPDFLVPSTKDFIGGLLKGNMQSFEDVKGHSYFSTMNWNDVKSKSLPSPLKVGHSSKRNATMSQKLSKHPSLRNILNAEAYENEGRGLYTTKRSLSRSTSSSELRSYSSNINLLPGVLARQSATSRHSLFFPVNASLTKNESRPGRLGISTNCEDYLSRNRISDEDCNTSDRETDSRLKSGLGWKPVAEHSAIPVNSLRPSYESGPLSTRHSVVRTASLNPSCLTNTPDNTMMSISDVSFRKSERVTPSKTNLSRTHEPLDRSQSSTDLASLVSSSVTRTKSGKSYQDESLNRSWSFTNLKETSREIRSEAVERARFVAVDQNVDTNRRATYGGQRGGRSLAWAPIPSFEEFRAMRSMDKACSDSCSYKYSDDNQCLNDKIQQQCRAVELTANPESLQGETGERKQSSFSSNRVIQELLVKYGLNKTSDVNEQRDKKTRLSITADTPTQTETTSSKRRLLSIVDEFLANRNKEKSLPTSKSMSEIPKPKSLSVRRTVSSPQMILWEEYHPSDSRSNLNRDFGKDLESRENAPCKIDRTCDWNQERSSCPSTADVSEYVSGKVGSIASQDVFGKTSGQTNRPNRKSHEPLQCHLKEIDRKTSRETSGRKAKHEKTKKNWTRKSVIKKERDEEKTRSVSEQQPEKISSDVLCSNAVLGQLTKSKALQAVEPHNHGEFSREIFENKLSIVRRKRASSEPVKEFVLRERKDRTRTFSQISQSANKDCFSNDDNHTKVDRTSSLLSLTDSITSCEEVRDLELEGELLGYERNSKHSVRTGSFLGSSVDSVSSSRERKSSRGSSFLSSVSDANVDFSRTESSPCFVSRGSSFMSNTSTDSGSVQLDYEGSDEDDDNVFDEKIESDIKRNDSGLGDEIGVRPGLKKRWEDIIDCSSRQWSVVASSARYWREVAIKKKERRLQQQQSRGVRKISHGRKNSRERSPNSIDCPDCGRPFVVEKDKPSILSEGPKRCLICYKCQSNRVERKETIIELVQTEINYANDFQILKEEFLSPMKNGGIVSPDNLTKIFLNIQELSDISMKFCKKIETSMEECIEKNDEEFCHMRVGKIFAESVEVFQAYELYCSKQPEAISLLESLQKKNEVLRVFLNITCRENPKCRKMDINSFLLAPVQRVMKYPLLLNRIRSATPCWHGDREDLKLAQRKVEEQIAKINSLTKSSEVKIKKFHSNLGSSDSVDSSRLKKLACDVLSWTMDEIQLLMHGVLKVTCSEIGGIQSWTKRTVKRNVDTRLLFCIRGQNEPIRVDSDDDDDDSLLFPNVSEVSDATLLLLKRKSNGKYTLFRDEIRLRDCIVYEELENDAFGLTHIGRETFHITARTAKDARRWLKNLRLLSKDQGKWRRRRNASANIMLKTS